MNKKLINGLLLLTVATGGATMFTSCKDNDDANLAGVYNQQKKVADALQEKDAELARRIKAIEDAGYLNQADREYLLGLISDNNNSIAAVKAWADAKIASMVTSIEIQRVYNNMFGTLNLPFGINSTVLANYYYAADNAVEFPNVASPEKNEYDGNKLNDAVAAVRAWDEGIAPEGVESLPGNNEAKIGSLGKIYVQVNPVSVPAEGLTVKLMTSKGKEPIAATLQLAEVGDDEAEFTFGGGTRSTSNPGLYVIDVPAEAGDIEGIKVTLDNELLQAAKDYINNKTTPDLATVAKGIYDQLINTNLPAYALRLGYINNPKTIAEALIEFPGATLDAEGGVVRDANGNIVYDPADVVGSMTNLTAETPEENDYNYLFSKYEIAVATVHPLSFNSIPADFSVTDRKLPTFGRIQDALEKLKNKFSIGDDWKIEIDDDAFKVEFDEIVVDLTGAPVYDAAGKQIGTVGSENDPVKIVLKELPDGTIAQVGEGDITPLINAIQKPIDEVKNIVADVNKMIDDINGQLKSVQDAISDIQDALDSDNLLVKLYDKVVGTVNNFLSDPSHYLQVYAAYKEVGGDLHHFSTNVADPTFYTGSEGFKVFLTSYNGEIIVPAYKKIVTISNVFDLDGKEVANAKSILEKANSGADLNKVLDGERHVVEVEASNLEKNYIYEIYYSALDYRGKTSSNKYYIAVK
ncbi:MAG: hypothetical protein HDS10_08435 [Bacteroides sp.]|nr:hypothetical protein [Bacteroides sp.]